MDEVQLHPFEEGFSIDHAATPYPAMLTCVGPRGYDCSDPASSYYGIVLTGECRFGRSAVGGAPVLGPEMYFARAGSFELAAEKTVLIRRWGYRTWPIYGGPVEADGRLSYIDNCRASVLVAPARLGDPVLNLLVFPPNTTQSSHVHPTGRLGVVVGGEGHVVTRAGKRPLRAGQVFGIAPFALHSFESGPDGLRVIAFHPDSDVGPTDETHPMKSRTLLR